MADGEYYAQSRMLKEMHRAWMRLGHAKFDLLLANDDARRAVKAESTALALAEEFPRNSTITASLVNTTKLRQHYQDVAARKADKVTVAQTEADDAFKCLQEYFDTDPPVYLFAVEWERPCLREYHSGTQPRPLPTPKL